MLVIAECEDVSIQRKPTVDLALSGERESEGEKIISNNKSDVASLNGM